MRMVKLKDMRLSELKEALEEEGLDTTDNKAQLVLRLSEHLKADEIREPVDVINSRIDNMERMIQQLVMGIENVTRSKPTENVSEKNENQKTEITSTVVNDLPQHGSVKDISETIPVFDPTDKNGLTVGQFINRVERSLNAFQWNEKQLLLAVYGKLKGVARLWLDSLQEFDSEWSSFSNKLRAEFDVKCDEADINFELSQAVRNVNEGIIDYCFRIAALGRRYKISDSAIIKYTRNGLNDTKLQAAIAPLRFNNLKDFREGIEDFLRNMQHGTNKIALANSSSNPIINSSVSVDANENSGQKQFRTEPKVRACFNCGEAGHFSRECSKPQRRQRCNNCGRVHPKGQSTHCGESSVRRIERTKESIREVYINGRQCTALLDTGSQCSLIRKTVSRNINGQIQLCSMNISVFGGGKVRLTEGVRAQLAVDSVRQLIYFYVVDDKMLTTDILLGHDVVSDDVVVQIQRDTFTLEKTPRHLIVRLTTRDPISTNEINCGSDNDAIRRELCNLINSNRDVFATSLSEIGKTGLTKMKITLTTDQPIVQKPYRVPAPKRSVVATMVNDLLENGIIQKSESTYASPIVLVKKKNGEDRLCVDYRGTNNNTIKEIFPTPSIEERLQ
ncbi:uncharacterized protein LOC119665821 [Teleopsis dalmanni]|uniref:uncharacterized protein LOC119665821 n=1 Tax=Teleopsis dalmanni TaxID=139649 RepID=UPI0018CF81EE|nr:uncharacterized protein LOC119665821 [Teleopsis dalmanni]